MTGLPTPAQLPTPSLSAACTVSAPRTGSPFKAVFWILLPQSPRHFWMEAEGKGDWEGGGGISFPSHSPPFALLCLLGARHNGSLTALFLAVLWLSALGHVLSMFPGAFPPRCHSQKEGGGPGGSLPGSQSQHTFSNGAVAHNGEKLWHLRALVQIPATSSGSLSFSQPQFPLYTCKALSTGPGLGLNRC